MATLGTEESGHYGESVQHVSCAKPMLTVFNKSNRIIYNIWNKTRKKTKRQRDKTSKDRNIR